MPEEMAETERKINLLDAFLRDGIKADETYLYSAIERNKEMLVRAEQDIKTCEKNLRDLEFLRSIIK